MRLLPTRYGASSNFDCKLVFLRSGDLTKILPCNNSFHQPDRQHTPYARALYAAMKGAKVNDKFQEALFLALELLRSGTLHNGRIGTKVYSGGPAFAGTEEDKRSMLLVMRVMSIVPLAFHVNFDLPTKPFTRS